MNIYIFFIFFFLLKKGTYSKSKIVQFKFEKYNINIANINSLIYHSSNYPNNLLVISKNDFMYRLLTDDLYFNLTIGSPFKIIPAIWNMNQYSFKIYMSSNEFNKAINYNNISEPFVYSFDEVSDAIMCKNVFYFVDEDNKTVFNLMKYISIKNDEKNYSFVGLQLPDIIADNLLTFTDQMKENEIINKYIFYIIYEQNIGIENPKGIIFFGDFPHNTKIFNNKYKSNNYFEVKAANRNKLAYWDILFDNIYFSESYKNDDSSTQIKYKQVELMGNMQLSIGTDEYQDYIQKFFFDKYIKENICEMKISSNVTDYIYCRWIKSDKFNVTEFPSLFFELKEINFNFSFDYNDLFFIHDEYMYFGIIFDRYFKLKFNKRWKLGSVIFKKYLLVFNQDSKTIGFYNNIINKNIFEPLNKNISNKKSNIINILKIFAIFFLFILIILLFRFIKRNINVNSFGQKNSKSLNYNKANVAHNFKNKNEIHNYYELNTNLI